MDSETQLKLILKIIFLKNINIYTHKQNILKCKLNKN